MTRARQLTVRILFGRTTSCPVILQALVRHLLNLPPTSLRTSRTVLRSSCCVIQHATFTLPPASDARSWVQNSVFPSPASSPPCSLPPVQFKTFISILVLIQSLLKTQYCTSDYGEYHGVFQKKSSPNE